MVQSAKDMLASKEEKETSFSDCGGADIQAPCLFSQGTRKPKPRDDDFSPQLGLGLAAARRPRTKMEITSYMLVSCFITGS